MIVRELEPRCMDDADAKKAGVLGVAVWGGSARDRDGQKSVSEWLPYERPG